MLKLSRPPEGPEWIELVGGSAVLVLPPSTPLVYAARAHAESLLADLVSAGEAVTRTGGHIHGVPDLASDEQRDGTRESLFVLSLAELAVTDWRGVLDADGVVMTFRAAGLVHLFMDVTVADAFRRNYLKPIHEVVLEGKRLRALAEWHFGKGRGKTYCEGCKAAGAACATTRLKDCTYHREAPQTLEGRMVWEAFLSAAWRVRVAGMSYIAGVVTTGILGRLVRDGMDLNHAEDLATACELGFVTAMNEKDDEDGADKN